MERLTKELIAPCGMNCGVCRAHLREKNNCSGCRDNPAFASCQKCSIRLCEKRKGAYCFECDDFPCARLKHLDKRYRTKYGMSEIENLKYIRENGIDKFVENERKRWQSEQGIYCVHDKKVY